MPDPTTPDAAAVERQVAEALDAGQYDRAATAIIRGYGPWVMNYLTNLLRDDGDLAADAFSLFAEQVWKGMPRFERRASARTWAWRAAWSAAGRVRDEAWRRHGRRLDSEEAEKLAVEVRTSTFTRRERQRAELEQLRSELSPEDQTLLALRLDQQLQWDEVAEILSTPETPFTPEAAKKRYERIKARLAQIIRDRQARGED